MLLGRPAMMRVRASESGEVVKLTRDQMRGLIQTDAEMSEILIQALIFRRIELVVHGRVTCCSSAPSARRQPFASRHSSHATATPFKYFDLYPDADVREVLDRFHVDRSEIPVMICRGEAVLKNPTNETIADRLGFDERIDQRHLRDVVIVAPDRR